MRAVREEVELRELIPGIKEGVVVHTIVPDGPAAKSTLKPSDIITSVDGKPVMTPQQLRGSIRSKKIGAPVMLQVYRQGKTSRRNQPERMAATQTAADHRSTIVPTSRPLAVELGITVNRLAPRWLRSCGRACKRALWSPLWTGTHRRRAETSNPATSLPRSIRSRSSTRKQFQAAIEKLDLKKGAIINLLSGNTARFEIVKAGRECLIAVWGCLGY